MSWPLVRDLKAAGWAKSTDGLGWTKNGAYYGAWSTGACVGQFEGNGGGMSVQIGLPKALPAKVILHLINAMADARDILEASS